MVAPRMGVTAPWSNQAYEAGLRSPRAAAASTNTGKAEVRAASGPPSCEAPGPAGAGGAAAAAVTVWAARRLVGGAPIRRAPASVGLARSRLLQGRSEP